jgi:predicted AlkP superfamily phosphohydrolase/phosphomutase
MAGIDANVDDLQSGIEASCRTADALHSDAASFAQALSWIKGAPVIESLVRRAAELQVAARDQHVVIEELREAIARLQEELKFSKGTAGPAPLSLAADRARR